MMLTGTPEQIAQALRIRPERIYRWRRANYTIFNAIQKMLHGKTLAAWWIKHKDSEIESIIKALKGRNHQL
jgi:hypothetical protein